MISILQPNYILCVSKLTEQKSKREPKKGRTKTGLGKEREKKKTALNVFIGS